jgi:sulfur carrier protein ThiS
MINVTVKVSGPLKKYLQGHNTVELPPGSALSGLLSSLSIPAESVSLMLVNGSKASPDHLLQDGDQIHIYPPVCGG